MTFSILHTSARPEKWREIYDAWLKAADRPELVQYILVIDKRWGFNREYYDTGKLEITSWCESRWENGVMLNECHWNDRRKCYVDGVNLAAEQATGDVFIVNADDQYPCEHWDTLIQEAIEKQVGAEESRFVVWANTGTPQEVSRRMMPMPILSLNRYRQYDYVFYPEYESMYADNDFCESAMRDADKGNCVVASMIGSGYVFPHKHPYFNDKGDWNLEAIKTQDSAYAAQNRTEAYQLGQRIFNARKSNNFQKHTPYRQPADGTYVNASTQPRRTIALCISGELFSSTWVSRWTDLIATLPRFHSVRVVSAYSTNVYHSRIQNAESALALEGVDYTVWIDDDNLVTPQQVLQLILDMECLPERVGMISGWTLIGANYGHVGEISCGNITEDMERICLSLDGLNSGTTPLKEITWTGFPLVIIRQSMLRALTSQAFCPYPIPNKQGIPGEDISFCLRVRDAGYKIYVDRRVLVPHLKTMDIAAHLQSQVIATEFPPEPDNKDYHEKGEVNSNSNHTLAAV